MSYSVLLSETAHDYYDALDEKSQRIVKRALKALEEEPYPRPGAGEGDREKLEIDGEEIYRLHVGRTHTAFYVILEEEAQVRIVDLTTIDEAHKRYDR